MFSPERKLKRRSLPLPVHRLFRREKPLFSAADLCKGFSKKSG